MFKLDIIMRNIKRFKPIRIFSTCGGFGYWWGAFGFFWHGPFFPTIIPRIWFNRCGVTYADGDMIGERKYYSWEKEAKDGQAV